MAEKNEKIKIHEIDAKNMPLGRVASMAATILRGKNSPSFLPNKIPDIKLRVLNIDMVKVTGNKENTKQYIRYSGYPGGQKKVSFKKAFGKSPSAVFIKTVKNMLANNKLRNEMLKKISFE